MLQHMFYSLLNHIANTSLYNHICKYLINKVASNIGVTLVFYEPYDGDTVTYFTTLAELKDTVELYGDGRPWSVVDMDMTEIGLYFKLGNISDEAHKDTLLKIIK